MQEKSNNDNARDIESYLVSKEKLKQLELKDLDAFKIRAKAQFFRRGGTEHPIFLFAWEKP